MRLEAVKREVQSSGTMQVAKATIKATPKIFDMFANDTYANKPLAIMRELVANGIDAHVSAGCPTRPVEVILPTELEPTCVIRDFGTGMDHDFVMGPFMAYTDGSTKDKGNDQIGGFGIGSKSPFAYVDQFTLRVVHQGVLSVYTMFKDEEGIPAVGLQGQTTTDEPNGVEVSFPVEDADMATFREAAQEALQYFQPLPLVSNGTLNPPDYTYVGKGWAMRGKSGPLGVIMGGVRYPVTTHSLEYTLRGNSKLSPLLEYGLDLTLPIGACGVAMSREQLSYIPRTTESIKVALEGLIDDVIQTFSTFFDDTCHTEWEAMEALAKETGVDSGHSTRGGRAQLMLGNAKFRGVKLETGFRLPDDQDIRAWDISPQRSRRGTKCPAPAWRGLSDLFSITPGRVEAIVIDDLPQTPKSKTIGRIRAYVDDNLSQVNQIIVIRGKDEHQEQALRDLLKGPTNVILTSTMPMPSAAPKAAKSIRPRVRMFTFNGKSDRFTHSTITNLTPANSKNEAVFEVKYVDQPASGIMVVMENFDLPADFHKRMATQLIGFGELHFVNRVDADKIKATFRNFDDVWTERLAKALSAYPELPARLALSNHAVMQAYGGKFRDIAPHVKLSSAAADRPFGRLYAAWHRYVQPLDHKQQSLSPFVVAALPSGIDPDKLSAAMRTKQADVVVLLDVLRLDKPPHRTVLFNNL